MSKVVTSNINIENGKLIFRNFSGDERKFNPKGKRNFAVVLEHDVADQLTADGWNVKWRKPSDPLDPDLAYLKVNVKFDGGKPPKIVLINARNKTLLDEDSVTVLDFADIETADLTIVPYNYDVNGKTGIAAYLKTMYVVLVKDEFESKYEDLPNSDPLPEESD